MAEWFWIIAGHNGSGKTTLARSLRASLMPGYAYLNADDITADMIGAGAPADDSTNLKAAQCVDALVDQYIAVGAGCVVETVLSSDKYKKRVVAAHSAGMRIGLIYVVLSTEELAIERVKLRVRAGGHDVSEDKIRSRRKRSLGNLSWFATAADTVFVFCNDDPDGNPVLLATKADGQAELCKAGVVAEVDTAIGVAALSARSSN